MQETIPAKHRCAKCGIELSAGFAVCPNDGTPIDVELREGDVFQSRFRLTERIGAGGMGVVFKAVHLTLHKTVAVKFLQSTSDTQIRRFQQEARALAGLNHPNLVPVHELDTTEFGQPYMVMDYIEGESLSDVLNRVKCLPPMEAIKIIMQVADALSFIHSHGIMHRDIKPGNIMICNEPAQTVKLLDFGIAKVLDMDGSLTLTGDVMGSPLYMSPEQAKGLATDSASDIYSLGCVFYELLTGAPPFPGSSIVEVLLKHASDPPPSLSKAMPGYHFPNGLETIIDTMLAKDPAQRFSSASELLVELNRLVGHRWYHITLPTKVVKSRPLVLLACVSFITIGIFLWLLTYNNGAMLGKAVPESTQEDGTGAVTFQRWMPVIEGKTPGKKAADEQDDAGSAEDRNDPMSGKPDAAVEKAMELQALEDPAAFGDIKAAENLFRSFNLPEDVLTGGMQHVRMIDIDDWPHVAHRTFIGLQKRQDSYLTLFRANHTDVGDRLVKFLTKFPLTQLELNETAVTRGAVPSICSMRALETLKLNRLKLQMSDIMQIAQLPHLSKLSLLDTGIGDEAVAALCKVHTLTRLTLAKDPITDRSVEDICKAKLPLTELNLGRCAITDRSLMLLQNSQLCSLWLNGDPVTDRGLKYISHLSLSGLDLSGTKVSGKALSDLRMPALRKLILIGCSDVDSDSVKQFKENNPECMIYYGATNKNIIRIFPHDVPKESVAAHQKWDKYANDLTKLPPR